MSDSKEIKVLIHSRNLFKETDGFSSFILNTIRDNDNSPTEDFRVSKLALEVNNITDNKIANCALEYLKNCEEKMNLDIFSRVHILRKTFENPKISEYKMVNLKFIAQTFSNVKNNIEFIGGSSTIELKGDYSLSSACVNIPFVKNPNLLEDSHVLTKQDAQNCINKIQNGPSINQVGESKTNLNWIYDSEIKLWRLAYLATNIWESAYMERERPPVEQAHFGILRLPVKDYKIDAITGKEIQ